MVKEFYVKAISEGNKLKCWVRGQHFTVTPYYDLNPEEDLLRDTLGDNSEFSPNGKSISVSSLSSKLRVLTTIMFHNLYPLSSTGYMNLSRALFLHDLITNEEIDICTHIFIFCAKLLRELP